MKNYNGCIIQGVPDLTTMSLNLIKTIEYHGMFSYEDFPLDGIEDPLCRDLADRQSFKKVGENLSQYLNFISQKSLMDEYIACCKKFNIDIRVLFVESEYSEEIWTDEIPELEFLGYEFCSVPLDNQIIIDLDWFEPLGEFKKLLNQNGLFKSYEDALMFQKAYEGYFNAGMIGDGEYEAYIFKVSRVLNI